MLEGLAAEALHSNWCCCAVEAMTVCLVLASLTREQGHPIMQSVNYIKCEGRKRLTMHSVEVVELDPVVVLKHLMMRVGPDSVEPSCWLGHLNLYCP